MDELGWEVTGEINLYSFRHPVEDKKPYVMTLTCFILHSELGNFQTKFMELGFLKDYKCVCHTEDRSFPTFRLF